MGTLLEGLFNDAYGHLAGDALRRALATVLRAQTREQVDLVARYGGEEFAIILPSTDTEGGLRAGERLREAIGDGPLQREIEMRSLAFEETSVETGDSPAAARVVAERIRHTVEAEAFDRSR